MDLEEPTSYSFAQILQATNFPIQEAVKDLNHQAQESPLARNTSRGNKASRAHKLTEASLKILASHPAHWAPLKNSPKRSSSLGIEIGSEEFRAEIGDEEPWADDTFPPRNLIGSDDTESQNWKPDETYILEEVGTWETGESEKVTHS
jgi:hypothetical protein